MSDNEKLIAKARAAIKPTDSIELVRAFEHLASEKAHAPTEYDPATDERLARYMAMVTPLDYQSALSAVESMTRLIRAEAISRREAHAPADDEREAREAAMNEAWGFRADTRPIQEKRNAQHWFDAGWDASTGFRRSEVPEPSTEGYAEFEDWEQEMFRHQPVLSMADGSIAGCQCLDRVFLKGREDWGTHLASVITARLPKPQGEPSDAQVDPWIPHARRALHIHDTWGTPDDPDGKVRPTSDYTELSARMANALRAALAVTEQGENR